MALFHQTQPNLPNCKHLAIMTRDLAAAGGTGSDNKPNDLGLSIAGHKSLRKIKPETTLVLTNLSLGHFCITSRCRQEQIYLRVLGHASLDMNIDSVISSRT